MSRINICVPIQNLGLPIGFR